MKKIFCLLTLLLILGACAQGTVGEEEEIAVKTEEEMDVAEDVGLDTQDVSSPKDMEEGVRTVVIPDLSVKLSFPDNYTLSRITNEKNRRGSFVAYRFKDENGFPAVQLAEVQFFSEDSIREFTKDCGDLSSSSPCFFGDYPTLDRYYGQKEAFQNNTNYYETIDNDEQKEFESREINGRKYFLTVNRCVGDACFVREYTTFIEGAKIDMSIMIDQNSPEQASAEPLFLVDWADELFSRLNISEL